MVRFYTLTGKSHQVDYFTHRLGCNNLDTQTEPRKIELYTYQTAPPKIAGVACGSRHTMVWLENGHVFSFGNNFFAQLGYDFKEKNYKENQVNECQ